MRRAKGFTLVELLVVILCLSVAVLIFYYVTTIAREKALRASCKANVSDMMKALAVYGAANKDDWPWLATDNRWDAPTGENFFTWPSAKTTRNVSALVYLLNRDGSTPGTFVCPATKDMPDPNCKNYINSSGGQYNWDFSPYKDSNGEHLSYSYQAPMTDGDGNWRSGVNSQSNASLVIMADKTPAYEGMNATFNWASPGDGDPATGMSQNHKGKMMNLLYADFHVGEADGRADVGIKNDNIYSAAGMGADGNALETNQGPGTLKITDHRSADDSFLMGPKKMEK